MRALTLLALLTACASPALDGEGYVHPGLDLRAPAQEETPLVRGSGWTSELTADGHLLLRRGQANMALRSVALPENLREASAEMLAARWLAGVAAGELGLAAIETPPRTPARYVSTLLDAQDGEIAGLPARLLLVDLAEIRTSRGRTVRGPTQMQVVAAVVRGGLSLRRDVGEVIRHEPAVLLVTLAAPQGEIDDAAEDFAALLGSLRVGEASE